MPTSKLFNDRRFRQLLVAALLAACGGSAHAKVVKAPQPALAAEGGVSDAPIESVGKREPCTLIRVVDGDTMKVRLADDSEASLRLLAVDTEESHKSPSKPVTPFGLSTSEWAKQQLSPGEPCEIEFERERFDMYGRMLVYFWSRGENYNLRLVKLGKSPYFTKYGYSARYHDQFVAAEKEAMAAKLGLWGESSEQLRGDYAKIRADWDRRADSIASFEKIEMERRDIFSPRTGSWRFLYNRIGQRVTVFTSIRAAEPQGRMLRGEATGSKRQLLEIVAPIGEPEVAKAFSESVGDFHYYSGTLTTGDRGVPRLVIERVSDVSLTPPERADKSQAVIKK